MKRRLSAIVIGCALAVASCASSDGTGEPDTADPVAGDTASDSSDDLFREGESTDGTVDVDVDDGDAAGIDENDDADSDTGSGATTTSGTADPNPSAPGDDDDTDEDADAVDDTDTDTDDPVDPDEAVDPQDIADDLAFDPAEVDDAPFCQSFAEVIEALGVIGFAGSLGQVGAEDPTEADSSLPETFELLVYPSIASDVEVVRTDGPAAVADAFAQIFERVDAASGFLGDAGLSDDEIEELATGPGAGRPDVSDLEGIDPRVREAADSLKAELGPLGDVLDALEEPDDFEEVFGGECPILNETLGAG